MNRIQYFDVCFESKFTGDFHEKVISDFYGTSFYENFILESPSAIEVSESFFDDKKKIFDYFQFDFSKFFYVKGGIIHKIKVMDFKVYEYEILESVKRNESSYGTIKGKACLVICDGDTEEYLSKFKIYKESQYRKKHTAFFQNLTNSRTVQQIFHIIYSIFRYGFQILSFLTSGIGLILGFILSIPILIFGFLSNRPERENNPFRTSYRVSETQSNDAKGCIVLLVIGLLLYWLMSLAYSGIAYVFNSMKPLISHNNVAPLERKNKVENMSTNNLYLNFNNGDLLCLNDNEFLSIAPENEIMSLKAMQENHSFLQKDNSIEFAFQFEKDDNSKATVYAKNDKLYIYDYKNNLLIPSVKHFYLDDYSISKSKTIHNSIIKHFFEGEYELIQKLVDGKSVPFTSGKMEINILWYSSMMSNCCKDNTTPTEIVFKNGSENERKLFYHNDGKSGSWDKKWLLFTDQNNAPYKIELSIEDARVPRDLETPKVSIYYNQTEYLYIKRKKTGWF